MSTRLNHGWLDSSACKPRWVYNKNVLGISSNLVN